MAITKDFINTIREEIAEVLGDSDVFGQVSAYPVSVEKIEKFPVVVVMISENEVAFASTGSQDSRKITLGFSLNIYYPATSADEQELAEEAMGEAVSEVLRLFCIKKPLASCDLAKIGITPWGETTSGEATYRTAQVLLTTSVYVDTV